MTAPEPRPVRVAMKMYQDMTGGFSDFFDPRQWRDHDDIRPGFFGLGMFVSFICVIVAGMSLDPIAVVISLPSMAFFTSPFIWAWYDETRKTMHSMDITRALDDEERLLKDMETCPKCGREMDHE